MKIQHTVDKTKYTVILLHETANKMKIFSLPSAAVDGQWGEWSEWAPCSATCGAGNHRLRLRTCSNPKPQHGGTFCSGSDTDREECNNIPCFEGKFNDQLFQTFVCLYICVDSHIRGYESYPEYSHTGRHIRLGADV